MYQIHKILLLHNNYLNHNNYHILELFFHVLMSSIVLFHLLFFGIDCPIFSLLILLKFGKNLDLILIRFYNLLIFHFDTFDIKYYILEFISSISIFKLLSLFLSLLLILLNLLLLLLLFIFFLSS